MVALSLGIGPCAGLATAQQRVDRVCLTPGRGGVRHLLPTGHDLRLKSSHVARAVAVEASDQGGSPQPADEGKPTTYHFVVANAKFLLDEEEHFKEQLYERLRLFKERNMKQDFWLVVEPKFLDKFPNITRRLKRPAVALVSTDGVWMRFMKLRLDRVLMENFDASSLEEALACNPTDLNFEKPMTWTAPYPKYESGWWETFFPPKA